MRWDHGLVAPDKLNFTLFGMGDSEELGHGMHLRCKSCHGQKFNNDDDDDDDDDSQDSQEY